MKSRHDLVKGHLRKAESDLANLDLCISSGIALDTACFHAQQAAERILKAYLIEISVSVPKTHNLMHLLTLAQERDTDFEQLADDAALLTPFAVQMRYDQDFWPSLDDTVEARKSTITIKQFCENKLNP